MTRVRKLELDLSDLHDKELNLQKEIEKLEQLIKPKRKFFRKKKKDSNDYEISQAKLQSDTLPQVSDCNSTDSVYVVCIFT